MVWTRKTEMTRTEMYKRVLCKDEGDDEGPPFFPWHIAAFHEAYGPSRNVTPIATQHRYDYRTHVWRSILPATELSGRDVIFLYCAIPEAEVADKDRYGK